MRSLSNVLSFIDGAWKLREPRGPGGPSLACRPVDWEPPQVTLVLGCFTFEGGLLAQETRGDGVGIT